MTDIVILVPVLRRPHRVRPLLESIEATTAAHRVLFLTSPDDHAEKQALRQAGAEYMEVPYAPGDYARKINSGYHATTEPLLFLGADDLQFHSNWLERAMAKLEPRVGVVGTNDLGSKRVMRGDHATHSLVTRDYCDRFGTIDTPGMVLHEGYPHEFVDDEFVETAKKRGAWAFAHDSHVEHLHPNWGKAQMDDLYNQQARRMRAGRRVYERRKHLWT